MSLHKQNRLFPLQPEESLGYLSNAKDDETFVEESYGKEKPTSEEPARHFLGSLITQRRFQFIFAFTFFFLLVLAGKAGYLQILHGANYRVLAEENRFREYVIPSERGVITDRNGVILAENQPTFRLVSSKELLPSSSEERATLFANLSALSTTATEAIQTAYDAATSYQEQIELVPELSYESAMTVLARTSDFPNVMLEVDAERTYVTTEIPTLSHALGYIGPISAEQYDEFGVEQSYRRFDKIGKMGVELYYEDRLRGTAGSELIEVDALGHTKRLISRTEAIDGEDVTLTIDSRLQSAIETILEKQLSANGLKKASVIVMNPQNGEILSLVSYPSFDANLFIQGMDSATYQSLLDDPAQPLFSRATAGEFPSGSTIKPTYAAAALIEGIITPTTTVFSSGGLSIGPWFFPDWRAGGHGVTNVYHAIADSVNTFFYMIGGGYEDFKGLGIEKMMAWAKTFGFGSPTGLDVAGEADGFLPSPEWKEEMKDEIWYIGDTYHVAIGQGDLLVTPLQIARSTAVFANGGFLVSPHLDLNMAVNTVSIISNEIAQIVKDAMRQTVTVGSARSLGALSVEIAGKTGTAQWSTVKAPHSWFTGFAPYDDPSVVVTVLIEEGGDLNLATPVARDIFNACIDLGYFE
ncbi:MAG: penicillin-binding protein 2 [Patescibacteria group bacterium]|jgi:penicillin-binding protein 2